MFERTHDSSLCFALFAWFTRAALLAGIAKSATDKACNECKTLGRLRLIWSVFKCSDTNVVFQRPIFLILVIRNSKRSQALTAKPATALPEFVYVTLILRFVSAGNPSLNRLNLWLLFFRWFPHGYNAACKKSTRLNCSKRFGIFS